MKTHMRWKAFCRELARVVKFSFHLQPHPMQIFISSEAKERRKVCFSQWMGNFFGSLMLFIIFLKVILMCQVLRKEHKIVVAWSYCTNWTRQAEENRRKLVLNRWIYVRKALEAIHSDISWQLHTTRPTESWKISLRFSAEVNVAWLWACCGGALVLSPLLPWKSLRVFLNALYRACYRCYKRSFSRRIWEYRNCERDKDAYFGCGVLHCWGWWEEEPQYFPLKII